MGLFDFVREAGRKLGLDNTPPTPDALRQEVAKHGLAVQDLDVQIHDDVATLRGVAASQEDREKAVLAAGNVHGIAKVNDEMTVRAQGRAQAGAQSGAAEAPAGAATAASAPSRFYTVMKGDTLSKIAKAQYGDANRYNAIFEANRPLLEHPDRIYPGQVLRIPNLTAAPAA